MARFLLTGSRHSKRLLTVALVVALPGAAMAADSGGGARPQWQGQAERYPDFDVRDRGGRSAERSQATRNAQAKLRRGLGRGGLVDVDSATGTPRIVADRDGFLARRRGSPSATALGFVRANARAFGLDRGDLDSLRLVRRTTTPRGLTQLEWRQRYRGVAAFDNVVRAIVAGGSLVNVTGSPEPDLAVPSTTPRLSATAATRRALASVGVRRAVRPLRRRGARQSTVLSGGNLAELVIFVDAGRPRLAWNVIATAGSSRVYRTVIDASTGALLKRVDLVAHASITAFDHFPGAASGGTPSPRDASTTGIDAWLTGTFARLRGDNAWTYSDEGDDTHLLLQNCGPGGCDVVDGGDPAAGQDIPPSGGSGASSEWDYPQVTSSAGGPPARTCPASGCTWNGFATTAPFTPGNNWQANREQSGAQVHYFVNNFHDHLQDDPGIQFDDASGNFEETAAPDAVSAGAVAGDRIHVQVADGASTGSSSDFPDDDHKSNANMLTLPERDSFGDPVPYPFKAPQMQMYLFTNSGAGSGHDVNGADDAGIVYHEFTHGLSNRLVDPGGVGGLDSAQGGAMGEAWSDWYAMDYLQSNGFVADTAAPGEVVLAPYTGLAFRAQGLDCVVGGGTPECPGGDSTGAGGFTYGDFGNICCGGPEEHADGEIWGETLWDLRRSLIAAHGTANGIFRARALVTDAMRLSSSAPDFLDMRNAILQADVVNSFGDCARIWQVFAARGMGAGAASAGGNDVSPTQTFANPSGSACPGGGGTVGGGGPGVTPGSGTTVPVTQISPPAKARLSGLPRSITVDRRGRFRLRFRGGPRLAGALAIRSVRKVRTTARRRATLLRRSFRVPGSGRVSIRLRLSRRNLRILKLNRRIRVRVTVVLSNAAGRSRTSRVLTLKAPRKRR